MFFTRPAWMEINLDDYKNNLKIIKDHIDPNCKILSIVKSDAYQFGANNLVEAAIEMGVENFAVATTSEAVSLRKVFKEIGILILGYTPDYLMPLGIQNDITMTTFTLENAKLLNEMAKEMGKRAKVHIAMDSGMNRIGFFCNEESVEKIVEICKMENLEVRGIFTHFAVSDSDEEYTRLQFNRFIKICDELENRGIKNLMRHCSNSHAIMNNREYNLDFVRPGILQYGSTEEDPAGEDFNVKFIATIKAQIQHIKWVDEGQGISYGLIYTTPKRSKIATLPLGYSDGIIRQLSGKIDVLVNGVRCKQIGRICMDQMMIDVTDVECAVGDVAVLVGRQGDEEITIEEIAKKSGEIPTSFVTHINKRLPRIYIENGNPSNIEDLVLKL